MDANRAQWNKQQKLLGELARKKQEHQRALDLFLLQHAAVHAPGLGPGGQWSFDEEVWRDLPDESTRRVLAGGEHSIAWMAWHIARCEDITFNLLVAGCPQVIEEDGWLERMRAAASDTGNAMDAGEMADFSAGLDLESLRAYRTAVGQRTREIVQALPTGGFLRKVDPAGIQAIRDAGAVVEAAGYLLDYWGKQDVAGLMLMPATRHPFVHLNEALRVKRKVR